MAVAKPGLQKQLNFASQSNSLSAMKTSFAGATRSQGVSFGIMAQRSIFSTGALQNPKLAYSPTIASIRGSLNAGRPMMFAPLPQPSNHECGDDSMNKFMMGMMAIKMISENLSSGIKDIRASRADRSEKSDRLNNAADDGGKVKAKEDSTTKQIKNSGALASVNELSNQIGTKAAKLSSGYSKAVMGDSIATIQSSLSNYINNSDPDLAKYKLSELSTDKLNISNDLGLSSDCTLQDIDEAKSKVLGDFTTINTYNQNLTTTLGTLSNDIRNIEGQLSNLNMPEERRSALEAQKTKLETLQTQLNTVATQVKGMQNAISDGTNGQLEQLQTMRAEKQAAMDKLYEQAQDSDKQIGNNNNEMQKLKRNISKETDNNKKHSTLHKNLTTKQYRIL